MKFADAVWGRSAVLRPFWVAEVDPETWEVVQEYPYPGFRANWIVIDFAQENMYVPVGGNSYLNKIDLVTGEIVWTTPTGTGPYGATLTADESQIWVADKGETTGMFGRTMTVIDMPGFGDAHGLVFVWYDDAGQPHVVRDQGGFHSGVNPARGNALEY